MAPDDQRTTCLLQVVVTDDRGRPVRKPSLARWLRGVAPSRARGTLTLALVSDRVMRRMNREFANHDYATDVLSFPDDQRPHLGDIVIATGVAARQAAEAGHSADTELRILALHGLLHLLGYDHATDTGQMARLEARLRREGGLRNGLIERASKPDSRKPRASRRESRAARAESRRTPR